jgi:DNA-binding beta-propeller fold protein YncE
MHPNLLPALLVTVLTSFASLARAGETYKLDPGFPELPPEVKLGAVSGVATDSRGEVLVFHRGEPPILVFEPSGKFVRAFGKGLFASAHGLRVDRDDNVWVTDNMNHTVLKLNPEGKVLLTLGERNRPGDDERHFNRPTDVAFAKNGDFYVSDGYGNSRVVKFDRDGKFLLSWGRKGKADGEFDLPHAVRVDSKGNVYVADRENDRIQVFDPNGKFLRKMGGVAPFGLFITREDTLFVADGRANRVVKMTAEGKLLASFGEKGTAPGQFDMAHAVTVGRDGAVYVCDINGKRVQKFVPLAP